MLSIREHTYHGKPGYLICGKDPQGRSVSIFHTDYWQAKAIKNAVKNNDHARVDDLLCGRA